MHRPFQLNPDPPRVITIGSILSKCVEQCAHIDMDGLKVWASLKSNNVQTPQLKS